MNGAEGYDRARTNFQTNPGYEFTVNQGLDALDRRANSRGMLSSGNNSIDTLNYVTGLADQQYGDYVYRLSPYLNLAPNLAGSQADLYSSLAGLYSNAGTNLGNLAVGQGRDVADLYTGTAGKVGGTYDDLARILYGASKEKGQVGADRAANEFAAQQGADQNLLNAILSVVSGTTNAAGQAGSFGNLFGMGAA